MSAAQNKGIVVAPRQLIFGAVLIVFVTLLAYLPAVSGGFVWDDDDYVAENQTLRSLDGLRRIWFEPRTTAQYYPLVFTTFWLEYHLWELQPFGYQIAGSICQRG